MNYFKNIPANSINWDEEYKKRVEKTFKYEKLLIEFVQSIDFNSTLLTYALNLVFTKSVNCFIAARVLSYYGLKSQSLANIRTGLENGWLGLLLKANPEKAIEWMTLLVKQNDENFAKYSTTYSKTYGRPKWIRENIKNVKSTLEQRNKLYKILSELGHSNAAGTFLLIRPDSNHPPSVAPLPVGIFPNILFKHSNSLALEFCLGFLLSDIGKLFGLDLVIPWIYNETELAGIAGVGYDDGEGGLKVIPRNINAANQLLLERYLRNKFGNIFDTKNQGDSH